MESRRVVDIDADGSGFLVVLVSGKKVSMKKVLAISIALAFGVGFTAELCWNELAAYAADGGAGVPLGNGDINGDGFVNITDVIALLSWMYQGGDAPVAIESLPECPLTDVPPGFTAVKKNSQGYWEFRHDQTGIIFVRLPGGTFDMGAQKTDPAGQNYDPNASGNESPVHSVTLSPFLIAKYEVTQAQWLAVMGSNPSGFTGDDNRPVEKVSWNDIQGFETTTGLTLPTEAQWEYACRGGTTGPYAGTGNLDEMGWYSANSGTPRTTHPVGQKSPNGFGLYDMHGNVGEWCEDGLDTTFYSKPEAGGPDPLATGSGLRVFRGGRWDSPAAMCRSGYRFGDLPGARVDKYGFRPAMPLPVETLTPLGTNEQGYKEYRHNQTGIIFVRLPGGKFKMGAQKTNPAGQNYDPNAYDPESPVHEVTLRPFLIAKYEVTQAQWVAVMGSNPSNFTGDDNRPVEKVSWNDIQEFELRTLLILPTEAQWEYACRAGTTGPYAGTGNLDDMGWYDANSGTPATTHPVGQKSPNGFGLYDMHGNVFEWCEDVNDYYFYSKPEAGWLDPLSIAGSSSRSVRGGSFYVFDQVCRSAGRMIMASPEFRDSTFGFRPIGPSP